MNNHTVPEEFENYSLGDDYELEDSDIQTISDTDSIEVVAAEFSNVDSDLVFVDSDSDIEHLIGGIDFEDESSFDVLVEMLSNG